MIAQAIDQLGLPESLKQALVQGAVAATGAALGGTAGASAALNEVANNYLTSTQELQRDKELTACKTLACVAGTKLKYAGVRAMQDVGLAVGVGGGMGYQTYEQGAAIVEMVKNLPETLTALNAIVNDPEFRARVGNQIADDYQLRIDMQARAYNDGGWDGSITAGVEAGRLAVDIVGVATGAVGAGKVAAITTKAGANVVAGAVAQSSQVTTKLIQSMVQNGVQVGAIHGFKSADEVNSLMGAYKYAPSWQSGSTVAEMTLKPGTRVRMVVDERAFRAIEKGETERAFGGWATFDNVPNQAYARNQLAITEGFKNDVSYVIEVEITKPIQAQVGVVGKQGTSAGGGNQLNFLIPRDDRASVFRFVQGSGGALP